MRNLIYIYIYIYIYTGLSDFVTILDLCGLLDFLEYDQKQTSLIAIP